MMPYIVVGLLNPYWELNMLFYVTLVACVCAHTHMQNKKCTPTKVLSWVARADCLLNVEEVKKQQSNVACGLIEKLDHSFLH
jgi:hypothetical protein